MKRNSLIMAGISLALACCISEVRGQNAAPSNQPAPAPGAPPSAATQPVAPGQPGQRPPPKPHQPRPFITRTLNDLRMVKSELQRSQDDFGGHKASALEACDKAMQELQAVLKAMPAPPVPQRTPPPGGTPPPAAAPGSNTGAPPPAGAPPAAQPPQ